MKRLWALKFRWISLSVASYRRVLQRKRNTAGKFFFFCNGLEIEMLLDSGRLSLALSDSVSVMRNMVVSPRLLALPFLSQPHTFRNLWHLFPKRPQRRM